MEILTPLQKEFLQKFFQTYLGEKFFSEDLDLFTLDQDLNFGEVNAEINKFIFETSRGEGGFHPEP